MILTGETEVLGEKHYTASVVDEWMSVEHWWNDTYRGNWSTGRKTLYSVGGNEWMSMEHWWNDTDRENRSTGRKTLYSVGGSWMNKYGALVEWYWHRKTEVLGEKHVTVTICPPQIPEGWSLASNPGLRHQPPQPRLIMRQWMTFKASYPISVRNILTLSSS
jgi:hypothetical protein